MCRRGRTIRQCQACPQQHKLALIGHAPLLSARDASLRPGSFNRREPNRVIGRANDSFVQRIRAAAMTFRALTSRERFRSNSALSQQEAGPLVSTGPLGFRKILMGSVDLFEWLADVSR
jgi:hypothetical protein